MVSTRIWLSVLLLTSMPCAGSAQSSAMSVMPSGVRVNQGIFNYSPAEENAPVPALNAVRAPAPPRERVVVPTFSGEKPVVALASAIGGQLSVVLAKEQVGSHLEPYTRINRQMPDNSLDAIVLRGLDRAIARATPRSERIFMRLNPVLLDSVAPERREQVAMQQLMAEIGSWPERQQWDRIVLLVPHYRASARNGLASKLHGVGVFFQNLNNVAEYEVIEPDGTPGARRRSQYVALYYYAMLVVIDAKSLKVIESQPWLIDEKIYDSNSASLNVATSIPIDVLAGRIETFAESASSVALTRSLGGRVEPGNLREVGTERRPEPATR